MKMKIIPAMTINLKQIMIFFLIALVIQIRASDQIPAPPQDHPIAITGATIHTVSGETIQDGTILFEKGLITAIGTDVALPDQTEVIELPDRHVYPGLIAANSMLGLIEIEEVRATLDYSETGEINPNVRAEVAYNPDSELLPVTRANGITLALSVPSGGLISGTSALMMLDGWTWEDMIVKAPVGQHINWPNMEISLTAKKRKKEQKKDIDEQIQKIRQAFTDARAYMKAKESEEQKGIPYHDTDARWEAMIPVLKGEIPVIIRADEIRQIEAAVDWAREENLKMVLLDGYDSWRVSGLLKEKNIPVIIANIYRLPERRWEGYDMPFTLPLKLYKAGVKFCIAGSGESSDAPDERNLPYQAATAAAYGLPKEEALKSITLYPAQILGVDDQVGSLEVGKDATLIVTDGDPLEIETQVEMEFIQGREIDLTSRHTQLYEKYLEKYRQMGIIQDQR
jgi:imidazolonepropionase-like amidohydrolase